jgi:hypothetical protein
MQERLEANVDAVRLLIDVLRDAITDTVADRAKRRLLLLLDAIEIEVRLLMTSQRDGIEADDSWFGSPAGA